MLQLIRMEVLVIQLNQKNLLGQKVTCSTAIDIKEGYYPSQPKDTLETFRKDVCDDLYNFFGIKIEAEHHEVATSGQCEINLVYDEMIAMADNVIAVKNVS